MTNTAVAVKTRILLVEDDQDAREFYGDMLRRAGYAVTAAACTSEAASTAGDVRPQAVVIDGRLQGSRDAAVIEAWRQAGLLVLVISSSFGEEVINPWSGADLVDRLADALRAARPVRTLEQVSPIDQPASSRIRLAFQGADDGALQARCNACLRASPPLARAGTDAEIRITSLGWVPRKDGWTCPICIERARTVRPPVN